MKELLPWLYLRGISTGNFQEALTSLVGEATKGLLPIRSHIFEEKWIEEYKTWNK